MRLTGFITLLAAIIFVISSCDRDDHPVMDSDPQAPGFTSDNFEGEHLVLNEEDEDEELLSLEWSEAEFGYDAPVMYHVQISEIDDEEFEDSREVASTNQTAASLTVGEVNEALIALGLPGEVEADLHVRVVAEVDGADIEEVVSDPIAFTATPYTVELEIGEVYVAGSFQEASGYTADWSPENAPALYSFADDGFYVGYVYMAEEGNLFKITREPNWEGGDWGIGEEEGTLDEEGPDIPADDPGYYRFEVDTDDLTYEMTDTQWGIIGDGANGWGDDDDIMMEYDSEERVWTAEAQLEAGGDIKFRANQEWEIDYGDDEGNLQLDEGGADIEIEESGTYEVILNLGEAPFSYELNIN